MVKKSSKGLVGALAVALATSGAPALAENADKIGNNQKCEYGAKEVSGFFNGMAHGFAVSDLADRVALKVADGGVVKYSPTTGLCEYKGTPYGSPVGLVGVVTENGVPVSAYNTKGLEAVDANMTKAYIVGGVIIAVGAVVAAKALTAKAAGSSSSAPAAAPAGCVGAGCGGGI
jgi:hypothetical protein